MSKQQNQTKQHFIKNADGWQDKAEKTAKTDAVIQERSNAVLCVLKTLEKADSFLDVGCGTGHLVLAVSTQGITSLGVDFSEKMIEICEQNHKKSAPEAPAKFQCASFFDIPVEENKYDVISAQGFIEYISKDELEEFFSRCAIMLRKNGALVLGSRNRLFNVFSLNEFTVMERQLGTLDSLISEAIVFRANSSVKTAIQNIKPLEQPLEHPDLHPSSDVKVDTRFQYAPSELIFLMRKYGFSPECIYPINFHCFATSLKTDFHDIHIQMSEKMNTLSPTDPRLIPQASTFVLDMRKR